MKKLAMIGCGGIGNYHLGHFLGFRDIVELAGFCDLIPEKAQAFVEKAGSGKAFTDYKEMYDEIQPDLVFICVPPYCHGEIEFETIRRGIPFFVEKPLALDLSLAREIRDAAEKKNLITGVGFQCRYSNLVEPNMKFCHENKIAYVDLARIGGVPGMEWWRKKDLSGGMTVECTIHQFDLIRYLFDEPVEVCTFAARGFVDDVEGYDTDDVASTIVRFKSGAIGTLTSGCYARGGNAFDGKLIFSSRDKRCELRLLNTLEIFGELPAEAQKTGGFITANDGAIGPGGKSVLYRQDGDAGILCDRTFIEAVISGDGSKVRSPYADAYKSLCFTMACNESIATGRTVKIEY